MIHWLWAFLAFVIGEFIGLTASELITTSEKTENRKKGVKKHVQKD